jgi:predicted AAA+ superfamily ATPase
MNEYQLLYQQASSLLLYQSVFENEIGKAFLNLLATLDRQNNNSAPNLLQAYGNWFKNLATNKQSWQDYLIKQILQNDNPFSQQVQTVSLQHLPQSLVSAAKYDLQILNNIYRCSTEQISQWIQTASSLSVPPIAWNLETSTPSFLHQTHNWTDALEELANYYRQNGTGIFAKYRAFRWQQEQLIGIAHPDPIQLTEIAGYEDQKETLVKNTEFLLDGFTALNVLLYGSRGSGKSSLVKGLLQAYGDKGLRSIEVAKSELKNLPIILEQLRDRPQKFIIFVDDLSFEEDDDAFKALKVVLEGNLTARANNVVVYATSNRKHLIREFFDDRPRPKDADEIHSWDTVQEKLSFSDRFGLTLTFEPANQDTYLNIVRHLAVQAKIEIDREELEFLSKQWATRHNGRSGRTARQFIDFLQAELAIARSNLT